MITRAYLDTDDWVTVDGRFAVVLDYWDGSGTGTCLGDPTMLQVVYNNGVRCDVPNDDRVKVEPEP